MRSGVLLAMICAAALTCSLGAGKAVGGEAAAPVGATVVSKAEIRKIVREEMASRKKTPGDSDDKIKIGMTVKFHLFDESDGKAKFGGATQKHQSTNVSAGVSSAIFYFSAQISEELTLEVHPDIGVHAGATPRLGAGITGPTAHDPEIGFHSLYLTYLLPYEVQLKAGYFTPLFTWDYGYELFWNEEYHASYVTANSNLGAWHATGLELYKSFEFEGVSVPAYLYVLNGSGGGIWGDNNDNKTVLFHVQPELLGGKLKFLGSYAFGRYDAGGHLSYQRYAAGINIEYQDLTIRSEFMGSRWENKLPTGKDAEAWGVYVKGFYRLTPQLRAMVAYNHTDHNFSGFFFAANDVDEEYDQVTLGLHYFLAEGATVMLNVSFVDAERADGSAELDFVRITLGTRITF